jgi:hypothetical protein
MKPLCGDYERYYLVSAPLLTTGSSQVLKDSRKNGLPSDRRRQDPFDVFHYKRRWPELLNDVQVVPVQEVPMISFGRIAFDP